MAASVANIEFRLSGGVSNTDPNASLGGAMSTVSGGLIVSQTVTVSPAITGIVINSAAGNAPGAGTLSFFASTKTLTWRPFGGTTGVAVDVSVNGSYAVPAGGNSGLVLVTITSSALPSSDASSTVTVSHKPNNLFDDITKFESNSGDTEYRTIYVRNKGTVATEDLIAGIIVYISSQTPGADVIEIGLDPAGKNGVAASPTLNVSNATWTGGTATVTVTGHPHDVGDWVVVAGTSPVGYSGVFKVTAAGTNTISYGVGSDPGSYVSGGTVVGEGSTPVGVTFSSPSSATSGLVIGDLDATEYYPVRIKRTIGSGTRTSTPVNPFTISLDALV